MRHLKCLFAIEMPVWLKAVAQKSGVLRNWSFRTMSASGEGWCPCRFSMSSVICWQLAIAMVGENPLARNRRCVDQKHRVVLPNIKGSSDTRLSDLEIRLWPHVLGVPRLSHKVTVSPLWSLVTLFVPEVPFLKEVSQKSFVFEFRSFIFEGSLAEKLCLFLKEVWQKSFVLELRSFVFEGNLAEKLCFRASKLCFWRKSRRKASFSSFQLESEIKFQINWFSNQMNLKSIEVEINWISNQLNLKSVESQSNWVSKKWTFKSIESEINWNSNQLNFKSVDSQINWISHFIRPLAEHQMLRLPRKKQRRPRDARAYIRPLAEHQMLRLPRKKQRRPRDARAYIRPLAEHQMLRLPRKKQRRPRDARAYIRPLAEHQMLRLQRRLNEWVMWVSEVSEVSESEWEWMSEWCEWKWMRWVSEWVREGVSEWVTETKWVSGVSEWVTETKWVSEWVIEWVVNVGNKAILRDFLSFWTWEHQKRSKSGRPPQFLNLTTSKTKQFWETSSCFEVDNIKNEAIVRDNLQEWKLECRADSLVPMRLAIFPSHLSKVLRLPRKSEARSYGVLHLSRKIIFPKLKIWCSKMQPLSGNQRPDLLASLMNMSLVLRLPRKMYLCRSSSNVPLLPSLLEMQQAPHVLLTFGKVQNPLRLPRKTTSEPSKVVRACGVFYLLTWTCASRHNGVHFFDISTSNSGPSFWLALFRHHNFQEWSEHGVFCSFWVGHMRRATMACTFSTSQLPKVVRSWCVLYILTWKCASRHNSVQFFISHLASWLRTRRFSEPTFRPSGATNHWNNALFRDFPFSRTWIFSLLRLSLFCCSFFFSSLPSLFPSLLSICPYCRKFDF